MPEPVSTSAAIMGGASLLGGALAASGASDAASTQAASADRAAALQKEMFERQMAGQEPYRQAGLAGQNRLMELLGLRMPAQAGGGAPYMRSDAELRNALAGQFTSEGSPAGYAGGVGGGGREGGDGVYVEATPGVIDETGLSRAMAAARQGDQNAMNNYQPPQGGQSADFGRYARDFGMSDFQQDPGYAFRLSEGQKLLDRTAARDSRIFSGGALKAATRYGQDMASQEYQNAFNRYQTNRSNQLQPLGNLMASGQSAASNQGSAAGQYGTNAGNLMMQGGQAMAAGQLGVGNTLNNALGSMASSYQNQQNFTDYLNRFGNQSPVGQPSYMAPQRSDIDPYSGVRNPQGYV
jgi:hypothetical protein